LFICKAAECLNNEYHPVAPLSVAAPTQTGIQAAAVASGVVGLFVALAIGLAVFVFYR